MIPQISLIHLKIASPKLKVKAKIALSDCRAILKTKYGSTPLAGATRQYVYGVAFRLKTGGQRDIVELNYFGVFALIKHARAHFTLSQR